MNQPHCDNPSDLDWLAQRYVLEEMTSEESAAFEDRLSHDEAASEALIRAVKLVGTLQAAGSAHVSVPETPPAVDTGRLRWAVGLALTAAFLMVALPKFSGRPIQDGFTGEAAALVSMWNEASSEMGPNGDTDSEAESVASDEVPEWLIAALATGGVSDDSSQVQEN